MRVLFALIGLLLAISACVQAPTARSATPIRPPAAAAGAGALPSIDVEGEVARLHAALVREVPGLIVGTPADERGWIARTQAAMAEHGQTIDRPQLLVVVDRNPAL